MVSSLLTPLQHDSPAALDTPPLVLGHPATLICSHFPLYPLCSLFLLPNPTYPSWHSHSPLFLVHIFKILFFKVSQLSLEFQPSPLIRKPLKLLFTLTFLLHSTPTYIPCLLASFALSVFCLWFHSLKVKFILFSSPSLAFPYFFNLLSAPTFSFFLSEQKLFLL